MKTVLIADDHEIVRLGIKMSIAGFPEQYRFVEASTCEEVVEILSGQKVHYAVLDMFLADGSIFSIIQQIAEQNRDMAILIYTMSSERIYAKRFIQKGVRGFVCKKSGIDEFEEAVQTVFSGDIYLSPGLQKTLFNPVKPNVLESPVDLLSDRELEVLEYMIVGMGIQEIAKKMKVGATMISTYRKRTFEKLDVQNTIELKGKFLLYKE